MALGVASHRQVLELDGLRAPAGLILAAGAVRGFMAHPPGIPCPLRALTGIPCPLCGMTTSVTATLHGDLLGALAANPGGLLAVAMAIAVLVARRTSTVAFPPWAAPVVLGAMWCFELVRFHVL